MPALQSQTDICNSALNRLGAKTILSINENSREARACQVQYDSNRRSELRKYRWNFAITRAQLAPNVTAPAFDFKYSFPLPSDCLRVLLPSEPGLDWVLEGKEILTNYPTGASDSSGYLNVRYIKDVEDPVLFDAMFYHVLSLSLAVDLCEILTQSNTKKQLLDQEYKDAVQDARKASAFEKLPTDGPVDSWVMAWT